jgi:hypothetical protein
VTRLPPVGYSLIVLEERARAARKELRGETLEAAASELGFTGLRLADGTRLTRGALEALARSVAQEAAHAPTRKPRQLTAIERAVLYPDRSRR